MTKKREIIITALSVAAIALALLLSSRLWIRADLTANKVYTISPASRQLAGKIPDQVKITYFVSGKLRQLYPIPGEIIDLAREYVTYSRGKIHFTVRDPAKDGIENDMLRLGIYPRQIQSFERNEASVTSVYSGILIEYMEKTDVIPFIFSLETLEYDLTSRIRSLASGKTREAGIIVADSSKSIEKNYRNLTGILEISGYKVQELPVGTEIP
ncbi:MAG: GldG family protein, partial [Treponema sp.]|nr:GldG family protein [Treponema sp.]